MLTTEHPVPRNDDRTPDAASGPLPPHDASVPDLLRRLLDDIVTWITLEGDLARAELGEKSRAALRGLILGAVGLVVILCGGIAVLLAVGFAVSGALEVAGVSPLFSHALGFLLSGILGAVAGWIVLQQARTILTPSNLTPTRTISFLRRAVTWAGEKLHLYTPENHEPNPPSP
jgi:hypothetical protein